MPADAYIHVQPAAGAKIRIETADGKVLTNADIKSIKITPFSGTRGDSVLLLKVVRNSRPMSGMTVNKKYGQLIARRFKYLDSLAEQLKAMKPRQNRGKNNSRLPAAAQTI
jgi:hypothetical protein